MASCKYCVCVFVIRNLVLLLITNERSSCSQLRHCSCSKNGAPVRKQYIVLVQKQDNMFAQQQDIVLVRNTPCSFSETRHCAARATRAVPACCSGTTQVKAKAKEKWTFETSSFKEFNRDSPAAVHKCFWGN